MSIIFHIFHLFVYYIQYIRFQPLHEKKLGRAILDFKNNQDMMNHYKIEINEKYVKFLYNNGLVSRQIRPGNLGAEAANAYLNSYGWHRSAAGLMLSYIRSDIWFLSVNISKFDYCSPNLQEEYPKLCSEFEQCTDDLLNLKYYERNTNYHLIYKIPLYVSTLGPRGKHKKQIDKIIQHRIQIDQLKFEAEWENKNWGPSEQLKLLEISSKPNWKLNEETLNQLFSIYQGRFTKQKIKEICSMCRIDFVVD